MQTQVQRNLQLPHREKKRDEMGQEKTRLKCCATFNCLIRSSLRSLRGVFNQVESTINDSHKVYDTTINCHQPMATKVAPTINLDHKSRTDYKLGPQKSH